MQTELPHYSYVILEGRDSIGGTWDLFKYPGIRSDSDMYTLVDSVAMHVIETGSCVPTMCIGL